MVELDLKSYMKPGVNFNCRQCNTNQDDGCTNIILCRILLFLADASLFVLGRFFLFPLLERFLSSGS